MSFNDLMRTLSSPPLLEGGPRGAEGPTGTTVQRVTKSKFS